MSIGELRVLVAKQLDLAWKELCEADTMRALFSDVGLSLMDPKIIASNSKDRVPGNHNNLKYTSRFDS